MSCPECNRLLIAQKNDGAKCVSCDWQGSQEELVVPEDVSSTPDVDSPVVVKGSVSESVEA